MSDITAHVGHMTFSNKRPAHVCWSVLLPETFEGLTTWSTCRYRCVWCILTTGTYFLPTVNDALASVNIIHVHIVWMCPKYPSKAWEYCWPPSKYCLCRTAAPFSWCQCALGLVQWATSRPTWFHHASTFFVCDTYMFIFAPIGKVKVETYLQIIMNCVELNTLWAVQRVRLELT